MSRKPNRSEDPFKKFTDFYHLYTKGLRSEDVQRLIRKETLQAYRFLKSVPREEDTSGPWSAERILKEARHFLMGFIMKLSPVRRMIFTAALISFLLSLYFAIFSPSSPIPYIVMTFVLFNFLLAMELADKLMLKGDLQIARQIQFTLLPAGKYSREGLIDIRAGTIPANTVGGDYYDVLELEEDRLGLAIGDVSGKGIPAALLMAYLQASLRALVGEEEQPLSELLAKINRHISRNTPSNSLITFFYGVLDLRSLKFNFCNAGHNRPFLVRRDGCLFELTEGGLPLGVDIGRPYEEGSIQLEPEDLLFCYTDGVTEAADEQGEEFGADRLERLVRDRRRSTPEEISVAVVQSVKSFVQDTRFRDDLTMLIARIGDPSQREITNS